MYKKVDLYVFSGTGNTYKAAETIGEISSGMGVDCEINMIDHKLHSKEYKMNEGNLIGLMAPTLGFMQPLIFFRFILSLPRGQGMKVFLVATGSWTKIGKLFIPGITGFGLYIACFILVLKGYKIAGVQSVGMPHNWTTFIPPYSKRLEDRILEELKSQITIFTKTVLQGDKCYINVWELIFGAIVFPISIIFVIIAHLIFAKSMFTNYRCNGCGLCSKICPNNAIIMTGKKTKRPYWTLKCVQCMRCAGFCPRKAVEGSLPLLIVYSFILTSIRIDQRIIGFLQIKNIAAGFAVFYITFILTIVTGYFIFISLNRIKFLNRIFSYSTFTFYWRKYKEPTVGLDKLIKNK
ncbi:MAG: EFR1 family ferrodoxin [Solirubrobacterales bacterium]